jgi:hypothetical protein
MNLSESKISLNMRVDKHAISRPVGLFSPSKLRLKVNVRL